MDRLGLFDLSLAAAVGPQVSAMHRHRATLDMLDKRHQCWQRWKQITRVVSWPWTSRIKRSDGGQ